MIKKKLLNLCCVLSLLIFLCACSSESDDTSEETSTKSTEKDTTIAVSGIDGYKEKKLDLEKYSVCNDDPTEANTSFLGFDVAGSDYGYYFWNEEKKEYLMFYDKVSGVTVPLCNRPDCNHSSSDCNAYYNRSADEGINFDRNYLQIYDGYLYMLGYNQEGVMYLFRVSEDGSTREQYMTLFKQDLTVPGETGKSTYSSPEIFIHKGYVYFKDERQTVPKLKRMKLGDDTTEVVFELDGERTIIYRVLPYGDYVFFQAGQFVDDTYSDADAGIFAYNVQTGELQMVKADAIATYTVNGEILYFRGEEGIYTFDLQNGKSEVFIKKEKGQLFSVDSKYIYFFELGSGVLEVYNLQGEYICNITDENIVNCNFSDGEYLYGFGTAENSFNCLLKVSDIATGDAQWQYIK